VGTIDSGMDFSPSIDERLLTALRRLPLDRPVAEIWRELGRTADSLGIPRPGYTTARRLVIHERVRQDEIAAHIEAAVELYTTHSSVTATGGARGAYDRSLRAPRR
jgi:hypothetical protein